MMKNNLFLKCTNCLTAAFTTAALILVLGNSGTLKWFPAAVVFAMVGASLLTGIIYPFVWQSLERKQRIYSAKIYGFVYSIIRYTLAFNLASFGWKKLLGLQFVVPEAISSAPMNQQSGEWLTCFYFGYSPAFGVILAVVQIVGACGLLFRKTLPAASFVLLAFMLNLTLINIFYSMNAGALIQSLIITWGIIFLLLSDYKILVELFFKINTSIPSASLGTPALKNLFRISAILLSLLFTLYLKYAAGR